MADATVQVEIDEQSGGRVARVTIDNRRRLNCLSTPLIVELRGAFEKLSDDRTLRAVVLTGAGERAFIGGADLNELGAFCADSARLFITRLHQACDAIRKCPVPVIGRINGFCLGAGLEVAASCDMRAAADNATFGMPEVHMGIPSVIEAALLPGLIGWGRTREMLLTGVLYSARRGAGHGLRAEVGAGGAVGCRHRSLACGHCAGNAGGGSLAESTDRPLGTCVHRRGHLRRHRCPVGRLQDRRAAGGDQGVLCGEGEEVKRTGGFEDGSHVLYLVLSLSKDGRATNSCFDKLSTGMEQ